MANVIAIKRSATTAIPASLAEGELAYSEVTGVKALYIGTNGGANIEKIGGKSVVDKVAGIAVGATNNSPNATLLSRSNHSGTQPAATITGLGSAALLNAGIDLATLVGGKVPTSQIPNLALTSVSVVANQAAQLALTVQTGDVAVRTDTSRTYIALNSNNVAMTNWQELKAPTQAAAVSSVNGQLGVIVLGAADVGAQPANANIQAHIASAHAPANATANAANSFLLARGNHTGSQPASSISNFAAAVNVLVANAPLNGGTF